MRFVLTADRKLDDLIFAFYRLRHGDVRVVYFEYFDLATNEEKFTYYIFHRKAFQISNKTPKITEHIRSRAADSFLKFYYE